MKETRIFVKQGDSKLFLSPLDVIVSYKGKETSMAEFIAATLLHDAELEAKDKQLQSQINALKIENASLNDFVRLQKEVNKQVVAIIKDLKEAQDSELN